MTKSESDFAPTFIDRHVLPNINFNGHCLINNIYIPKKVINLYVSYTPTPWLRNLNTDFTLKNCWFGSIKLTKKADLDKYKYSGYHIGFDSRSEVWSTDESMGKNVTIFELICAHLYLLIMRENILILGEGLDDTTLTAEAIYLLILHSQIKDLY